MVRRPGVYFDETTELELVGIGAKIPVVIGATGNTGTQTYPVDGTNIQTFRNFDDANKSIANGGIGTDTSTNKVLAFLEKFFEEAEPRTTEDLGVPFVYVIDVGDGTTKQSWLTALTNAKKLNKATAEVYIGADNITDYTLSAFISGAMASIATETTNLNLRTAFFTKEGATDEQLIALNPSSGGILDSRCFLCEPLEFGKTVARFCTTPYWVEPGFLPYRTVTPGTFKERTNAEIEALQAAGVVINCDEVVDTDVYCRINLSTSTAYAATKKPADALGHCRFNADHLLREIFKAVYPQVKNNEVTSQIVKSQTRVDAIIDAEVEAERIIGYNSDTGEGTKLTLVESNQQPYGMELIGDILCVNSTHAINVKAKIRNPIVKSTN